MDSSHASEPGTSGSAAQDALEARERAADERDRLAEERDRRADQREADANERERKADERDAAADAREREADRREAVATERERRADERERTLDEHRRELGAAVEGLDQRMLETIKRSRDLLALSGERLNRQEAKVKRDYAHREREQEEVSRASAETERKLADWLPEPSTLTERGEALRRRVLSSMGALAANEEEIARIYQDLAARHPERRWRYLQEAEHARESARSAREFLARFTA